MGPGRVFLDSSCILCALASLAVILFQLIENFEVIVRRIELGMECAPDAVFEGEIHFSKFFGRQSECDDMANAHHDVVGKNFNAIRRESLSEASFCQVIVDFIKCLRLIMAKNYRQHDFAVCICILRTEIEDKQKESERQYPFHLLQDTINLRSLMVRISH